MIDVYSVFEENVKTVVPKKIDNMRHIAMLTKVKNLLEGSNGFSWISTQ